MASNLIVTTSVQGTSNTTTRAHSYELDMQRARNNLAGACSREQHIKIVRKDAHNYRLFMSAAAFGEVRDALLDLVRVKIGTRPSRYVERRVDTDKNGRPVTETYKISNWAAIVKKGNNLAKSLTGPCTISINTYITKSDLLINGESAEIFMRIASPILRKIMADYQPI